MRHSANACVQSRDACLLWSATTSDCFERGTSSWPPRLGTARKRVQTFAEAEIRLYRDGGRSFTQPLRIVELALAPTQLFLTRRKHSLHPRDLAFADSEPRLQ